MSTVTLAGGLELLLLPYPGCTPRGTTPAEALGAAAAVLAAGADDVYVFNYFPSQANWSRADYLTTLRAMNSLAAIEAEKYLDTLDFEAQQASVAASGAPKPAAG